MCSRSAPKSLTIAPGQATRRRGVEAERGVQGDADEEEDEEPGSELEYEETTKGLMDRNWDTRGLEAESGVPGADEWPELIGRSGAEAGGVGQRLEIAGRRKKRRGAGAECGSDEACDGESGGGERS